MKKWICAVDLSINGSSLTLYNKHEDKYIFYCYNCKMPKKSKPFILTKDNYKIVIERKVKNKEDLFLDYIKTAEHVFHKILELAESIDIDFLIEGYSFGSTGKLADIGEFTGLFKNQIIKTNNTYETVPPTTWKKNIVGKGNSNKEAIINFCCEEFEIIKNVINEMEKRNYSKYTSTSPINDLCDSFCILKYFQKNI